MYLPPLWRKHDRAAGRPRRNGRCERDSTAGAALPRCRRQRGAAAAAPEAVRQKSRGGCTQASQGLSCSRADVPGELEPMHSTTSLHSTTCVPMPKQLCVFWAEMQHHIRRLLSDALFSGVFRRARSSLSAFVPVDHSSPKLGTGKRGGGSRFCMMGTHLFTNSCAMPTAAALNL
jgi:hypothetical protein